MYASQFKDQQYSVGACVMDETFAMERDKEEIFPLMKP